MWGRQGAGSNPGLLIKPQPGPEWTGGGAFNINELRHNIRAVAKCDQESFEVPDLIHYQDLYYVAPSRPRLVGTL
jgi:hypothetical protein